MALDPRFRGDFKKCVVIGIGNPDRGDDAAGCAVARQLVERLPQGVRVVEHDGEPCSLLMHLMSARKAFLIDASASGLEPGTIRRFDVREAPLPAVGLRLSSHGLGLPEAIELARALRQLPASCIVYAIEAATFEAAAPLSPPVMAAVSSVVEQLVWETSRS